MHGLLTSTHAYSSQPSPLRSHPGSGYLRCTGNVISARMRASRPRPSSWFGVPTTRFMLTTCCPDTEEGSSTSIGFPSNVSTHTLPFVGGEEDTSKSWRACSRSIEGREGHTSLLTLTRVILLWFIQEFGGMPEKPLSSNWAGCVALCIHTVYSERNK